MAMSPELIIVWELARRRSVGNRTAVVPQSGE